MTVFETAGKMLPPTLRVGLPTLLRGAAIHSSVLRDKAASRPTATAAAMMAVAALLNVKVRRKLGITLSALASRSADAFARIQRP
jgi:hypothetical protein